MKRGSAEDTYNTVNGSVVWNDDLWRDATWIPTTQQVSLVGGVISRNTPPTLKLERKSEINE